MPSRHSSWQKDCGQVGWANFEPQTKTQVFSTAIQTWALPADYGSFPKWLSSCLVKRSLGLEEGWGPDWGARSNCGKVGVKDGVHKWGGKCLVSLEARDIIDHGIQNVFCTVQVYGKRLYAEKSQSKLCIKYKSSFMKKSWDPQSA